LKLLFNRPDRREDPEKVVAMDGPNVAVIASAYSGHEMLESFLEKYGYLAILVGTAIEGEMVLVIGGFTAHRGYLSLFPWVILAGFAGNYIQNHVFFVIGRRYGVQAVEKHPEWRRRLQRVHSWLERYRSPLIIGVRFMPGFHTVGGVAIGMSGITLGRFAVLNGLAALMWALVFGCLGYLCGHAMELILGDIKHLEVPILVGLAACGFLWFFYRRRRVGR